MQSLKRPGRTAPKRLQSVIEPEPEGVEPDDEFDAYDTFEMYRVICPDCAQPIALLSDEDALPHEHEQAHRAIVDKLLNGGILKASELGTITVEREEDEKVPEAPVSSGPQGERQAQSQGH